MENGLETRSSALNFMHYVGNHKVIKMTKRKNK